MMRSILTAVVSAIEACAVGLAAFVVIVLGALLVWWQAFDLAADPGVVFEGAASLWSLAFFVPLGFEVPIETMAALGLPHEALKVVFSIAPLGVTLGVVALAIRAGWRWAGRGLEAGLGGIVGSGLGIGVFATVMAQFSVSSMWPMAGRILMPVVVYLGSVAVGSLAYVLTNRPATWQAILRRTEKQLAEFNVPNAASFGARFNETIFISALLFVGFAGLAACGVGISLFGQFAEAIAITQGLQLDGWGVVSIWIAELLYLPVAWIWGGAWLTGASIDLGGGGFSAFGSPDALLPAFPLFAALPEGWGALGLLVPLCVVLLGVLAGHAITRRFEDRSPLSLLGPVLSASVLVGLAWVLLSVMAAGSLGPGTLAHAGPNGWAVGGLLAGELAFGSVIGLYTAQAGAGLLSGRTDSQHEHAHLGAAPTDADSEGAMLQAARAERSRTPWWTLGDRAGQPETGPITTEPGGRPAGNAGGTAGADADTATSEDAVTAAITDVVADEALTTAGTADQAGARAAAVAGAEDTDPEMRDTGDLPAPISLSAFAERQAAEAAAEEAAAAEVAFADMEYHDSGATAPGDGHYETESLATEDFGTSFFGGGDDNTEAPADLEASDEPRETPLYDREAEARAEAAAAAERELERQRAAAGPAQAVAEEEAALAAYSWDSEPDAPQPDEGSHRGWRKGPKKR